MRSRERRIDYDRHQKTPPVEGIAFRIAGLRRPWLEGLTRGFGISKIERERGGRGVRELVKAAMDRLSGRAGDNEAWHYTRMHSMDVARFIYIMIREAQRRGLQDAQHMDPKLAFAGGLVHDIGKTFLPRALLVKELGIDLGLFTVLKGARLNEREKHVLRLEHITIGTTFVRLFGNGTQMRVALDMVGLHHVAYLGKDTGVPSYPSMMKGVHLPFHIRAAKAADLLSAAMPRHYRTNGFVASLDDSVAHAITVAGVEADPVAVQCFIAGHYDVDWETAGNVVRRLAHPEGVDGVSDIHETRVYAKEVVREDPEFKEMVGRRSDEKAERYGAETKQCFRYFGIDHHSPEVN